MEVFAAGISTETHSFSPIPTGARSFEVIRGSQPGNGTLRAGSIIDIFRRRSEERGWNFNFSLEAIAEPAGVTVRRAYEELRDEILADLRAALPVDIVLLSLHGAMVAEGYDDCEGDLIARIREIVGPSVLIGVELDLHCHLTSAIVDQSDVVVLFKEYPHSDMGDRANDLFQLIADSAEGKIRPVMSLFDCRMMGMYLTSFEPMRSFVDEMMAAEGKGGVLSLSLAHGFPWGDVPESGVRMLSVVNDDQELAQRVAEEWGRKFYSLRDRVSLKPLSLEAALDRAATCERGPVVIADQSDNPGGGAAGDSTFALRALLERGVRSAAVAMIYDPGVVELALTAGAGARLRVRLGGKFGPASGDPLDLEVEVVGVIEGMTQEWPQTEGALIEKCGDAAALRIGGIDVIVANHRIQVFSPQVFTNFGIDPSRKEILVIKSAQHFYTGFAPLAAEVLYMAAPGSVVPIMTEIPLERADLAKYPWLEDPFGF